MVKSKAMLSIGAKFALIASALVLVSFGLLWLLMSMTMTRYLDQEALNDLTSYNQHVQDLVRVFDGTLDGDVARLSKLFAAYFPERIQAERSQTVRIGGFDTPVLRTAGERLNLNFSRVDAFTARSGATATVFARSGRDFIRISTSLKTETGQRAVGTALDREHPGYRRLLDGLAYRGPAVLFGRQYMTVYEPRTRCEIQSALSADAIQQVLRRADMAIYKAKYGASFTPFSKPASAEKIPA